MERYLLGETILLPVQSDEEESPAPVNRVEVIRPDGTTSGKDWDHHRWRSRVDQTGIWHWRVFIRAGDRTGVQSGEFEVVGGGLETRIRPKTRILARFLRPPR